MSKKTAFKYFKTSPVIIKLTVMYYVRFPLSLRQGEDVLHERGIDVCHETIRYWWNRFGPLFANKIKKSRIKSGYGSKWRWHMDEVFVKINGKKHYLWHAIDQEGEVLECYVTTLRDRKAAKEFLEKHMRKYGNPDEMVTDKCPSYKAAMKGLGIEGKQRTDKYLNNSCELSHQPFRDKERSMRVCRTASTLQKFASTHATFYNHFNQFRNEVKKSEFMGKSNTALQGWRELSIAKILTE